MKKIILIALLAISTQGKAQELNLVIEPYQFTGEAQSMLIRVVNYTTDSMQVYYRIGNGTTAEEGNRTVHRQMLGLLAQPTLDTAALNNSLRQYGLKARVVGNED